MHSFVFLEGRITSPPAICPLSLGFCPFVGGHRGHRRLLDEDGRWRSMAIPSFAESTSSLPVKFTLKAVAQIIKMYTYARGGGRSLHMRQVGDPYI